MSHISGCFFQIAQSLYRTIQQYGLINHYKKNVRIREVFRMICGLSFVEIDFARHEFDKLDKYIKEQPELNIINEFWENLKTTYLKCLSPDYEYNDSIFDINF
ncbi:hypothetical protein DMUE_0456 [Dictyocoela muelleri]|nr:hypothetical protein DMUE_0456 [Dictyocoela muelleri]